MLLKLHPAHPTTMYNHKNASNKKRLAVTNYSTLFAHVITADFILSLSKEV